MNKRTIAYHAAELANGLSLGHLGASWFYDNNDGVINKIADVLSQTFNGAEMSVKIFETPTVYGSPIIRAMEYASQSFVPPWGLVAESALFCVSVVAAALYIFDRGYSARLRKRSR